MRAWLGFLGLAGVLLTMGGCSDNVLSPFGCDADSDCQAGYGCINKRCEMLCGVDGAGCEDGNPCTMDDTCSVGTCVPGPTLGDGTLCNKDGDSSTRDICLAARCVASSCGDGYVDSGGTPPEDCDDGNLVGNDGCEWNCQVLPPGLTIVAPERGATLTGGSDVLVRGVALDDFHGIAMVTVNGQAVTVSSDGTWGYRMTAAYGLNTVEAIAVNDAGKRARRTLGFYYSTSYLPYAQPVATTAKVPDALFMRLSQEAIDDHVHPCGFQGGVYGCTEVDDIATLGEISLNNLDLQSSLGSIEIYGSTHNFLTQSYGVVCDFTNPACLFDDFNATLKLTGDVNVTSEITELDFNALTLALDAQSLGLDAKVAVSPAGTPAVPGFVVGIRTTVALPLIAKIDKNTITATLAGFDIFDIACVFWTPSATPADEGFLKYVCPHQHGTAPFDVDPVASLIPSAWVDSGMSIDSMVMNSRFAITVAPGGGAKVTLLAGTMDFMGSQIELDAIQSLMVDLGTLDVLGLTVDLGQYPLTDLVGGLDTIVNGIADFFANELQMILEPAISLLLLNPSDPLSVGGILEAAIDGLAPNRPMAITTFAGQTAAPQVAVASTITSISTAAMTGTNLLTGGVTPGLDLLFGATKTVQRNPLGTILADGCYGTPEPGPAFPRTAALEDAYHVDAVNQALFAVWWNGGFNAPFENRHLSQALPAELGVGAFTITPTFYTAPILANCGADRLTLQVADVNVGGSFTVDGGRNSFQAFVSAKLPVNVGAAAGKPVFVPVANPGPQLLVEVVSNPGLDAELTTKLASLLQVVVANEILVRYGSAVLAALPEFELDLSALGDAAGAAVLKLEPLSAQTTAGYTVLRGDAGL